MIGELEARFSGHSSSVMLEIQCLNPSNKSFLDLVKMSGFIDNYCGDMEDLTHEVKKLLQRTKPVPDLETMLELAMFLDPYKLAFHELYRLVHIAPLTITLHH